MLIGDRSPFDQHPLLSVPIAFVGYLIIPIYTALLVASAIGTYVMYSHRTTKNLQSDIDRAIREVRKEADRAVGKVRKEAERDKP